jgi:hypothetical protein
VAEYEDSSLHKHETSTYGATTRDIYRIIVCGCKKPCGENLEYSPRTERLTNE